MEPSEPLSPADPAPVVVPSERPKVKANKIFYTGTVQDFVPPKGVGAVLATRLTLNKKIKFGYTGTPAGLMKTAAPGIAATAISAGLVQWAVSTQSFLLFFVMLPVLYAAVQATWFLIRRYRISHARLGAAGFKLSLSLADHMKLVMKRAVLNLVTFGYFIPQSDLDKWTLFANNLQLGGTKFAFRGDVKPLRWLHTISFYMPLLFGIIFILLSGPMMSADAGINPERVETGRSLIGGLFFITIILGVLGRAWYRAALKDECLRGLRLGGVRFKRADTGKDYFKFRSLNILIFIATLGLAFPFVQHRRCARFVKTLVIGGDLEAIVARQSA